MSKHVRANCLAFVLDDEDAHEVLAGKHVEVVEPEVGENFLQLPFAVDGTQDLLFGEVGEHLAFAPGLGRRHARRLIQRLVPDRLLRFLLSPSFLRRTVVVTEERRRRFACRRQPHEPGVDVSVVDALWMQLPIDERLDAHPPHLLDVAGSRTKCDAVEDMGDGPVVNGRRTTARRRQRRCSEQDEDAETVQQPDAPVMHATLPSERDAVSA